MGAATAMAAAAAMAATLVAAFSAEQDTTATGAWWLLGETREEVRGSASRRDVGVWREADASAIGAAPAGANSAPYPQRGRGSPSGRGRVCLARASPDRVPRGLERVLMGVSCAYLGGDLSLGLDARGHLGGELGLRRGWGAREGGEVSDKPDHARSENVAPRA